MSQKSLIKEKVKQLLIIKGKINLLKDLYGESKLQQYNEYELNAVLNRLSGELNRLPEGLRKILDYRYGLVDGKCLEFEEIAKLLHVTVRYVDDKCYRAFIKMKHPTKLIEILYGDSNSETLSILRLYANVGVNAETTEEELTQRLTKGLDKIDIKDLELSTRSYNCLKRAGVDTMQQLIDVYKVGGIKWFEQVKNLGKASVSEIITKLNNYCIENEITDIDSGVTVD